MKLGLYLLKDLNNLLPVRALSVDVVAEEVEHVPSIGATQIACYPLGSAYR